MNLKVRCNYGSIFIGGNESSLPKTYTLGHPNHKITREFIDGFELGQYLSRTNIVEVIPRIKLVSNEAVLKTKIQTGPYSTNDNIRKLKNILWDNTIEANQRDNLFWSLCTNLSVTTKRKYLALVHTSVTGYSIIQFNDLEFLEGLLTYSSWIRDDKHMWANRIELRTFEGFSTVPLKIRYEIPGNLEVKDIKTIKDILDLLLMHDLNNIILKYLIAQCTSNNNGIKCVTLFNPEDNLIDGDFDSEFDTDPILMCPGCWASLTKLDPFVCKLV